jgi:hypothetical protein
MENREIAEKFVDGMDRLLDDIEASGKLLPDSLRRWCTSMNDFFTLPVAPPYQVRFIQPDQVTELMGLWQTSKIHTSNRHERLLKTVDWFTKAHPHMNRLGVYKDLDCLTQS